MPRVTPPATARPQEDVLFARPRQAAFLTAGVVAVTAVVFALATGRFGARAVFGRGRA